MEWNGDGWRRGAAVAMVLIAGGMGWGCDAKSGGTPAAVVKVTADQEKAAKKMVAAAEKTYAGIMEIEEIRPRTPEFADLKVQWSRIWVSAELLLHPRGAEAVRALQAHLERMNEVSREVKNRADEGAVRGTIAACEYAVADAEFDLAANDSTGELSPAMRAAAEKMTSNAKAALAGVEDIVEIRPTIPEFFELRIAWSRRVARADSLLQRTAVGSLPVMEAHRTRMRGLAAKTKARADALVLPQADYALAEAEYLLEMNAGNGGKLTVEQRDAAQAMLRTEEAVLKALDGQWGMRPRTPELLQLRLTYSRRVAEAGMILHPSGFERRGVVDDYLKRSRAMVSEVAARTNVDVVPMMVSQAEYSVAEGEFWMASGK